LMLGGDNLSGTIHDELIRTNDEPVNKSIFRCKNDIIQGILLAKRTYGRVWAVCVCGNHTRSTDKIEAKDFNQLSYDWLIYHLVAEHFANDPDVKFLISDAIDVVFDVFGTPWMLNHGFNVHGGQGIAGVDLPIALAVHKAREVESELGTGFKVYAYNHFHRTAFRGDRLGNGSVIGYNEFAMKIKARPEAPQQNWGIIDPRKSIVFPATAFCNRTKGPSPIGRKDAMEAVKWGTDKWR
jgi:hypothetical protein